jgi:uncharacterized protein (TIGR02444 family)
MRSASGESQSAGEAFWRFSLALYARPGVSEALLGLQDRTGRDVNLILFGLWLGATQSREINGAELAAATTAAAPLNAVVARIRAFRRELKSVGDEELRHRVLFLELAAERRVQYQLAATLASLPASGKADPLAAVRANLVHCLDGEAGSAEADTLCSAVAGLMRL